MKGFKEILGLRLDLETKRRDRELPKEILRAREFHDSVHRLFDLHGEESVIYNGRGEWCDFLTKKLGLEAVDGVRFERDESGIIQVIVHGSRDGSGLKISLTDDTIGRFVDDLNDMLSLAFQGDKGDIRRGTAS